MKTYKTYLLNNMNLTVTLEEILEVAQFNYDEEGRVVCTILNTDIIGNFTGDHWGTHKGDHWGKHIGNHWGKHIGNHND